MIIRSIVASFLLLISVEIFADVCPSAKQLLPRNTGDGRVIYYTQDRQWQSERVDASDSYFVWLAVALDSKKTPTFEGGSRRISCMYSSAFKVVALHLHHAYNDTAIIYHPEGHFWWESSQVFTCNPKREGGARELCSWSTPLRFSMSNIAHVNTRLT